MNFYYLNSQSLSVFNIDTINFPKIQAKFYALDNNGKQILNLTPSDFDVRENGLQRTVTKISCPEPKPPLALSSVLVMDISGSMTGNGLEIARTAANSWVEMLDFQKSECALTSFNDLNYLNQDFTNNKMKIMNSINNLVCKDGTNYDAAFLNPGAGGLLIAKTGKNKRVIVFLTDGDPNYQPNIYQIISQAKANKIIIYCVTVKLKAPQCLKDISKQTGGVCFENIRTKEEAEDCYRKILFIAQSSEPCEMEWISDINCPSDYINVEIKLSNLKVNLNYKSSYSSEAALDFKPASVNFTNTQPGIKKQIIINVIARNADFKVSNIISSNSKFEISPLNFILSKGTSTNLTVSYTPNDSGFASGSFDFVNNMCKIKYNAIGGYRGKKPKIRTIKLTQPNGGEVFVAGKDTLILWEGISPEEIVRIDYSTNKGRNWIKIADSVTGQTYRWKIPKTIGNQCLAKITTKFEDKVSVCSIGDVKICNQFWMGCNLNVNTYSNGDMIPEIQDSSEWANATEGAWCYYNNDPDLGSVYGKLYNWYAVNDPRGLAPKGWHIPSDAEWKKLENCLGDENVAGGKLKEEDFKHWMDPNLDATNLSGFTALPAGCRFNYGAFNNIYLYTSFWTSNEDNVTNAWNRHLNYSNGKINKNSNIKNFGFSVRCIKD